MDLRGAGWGQEEVGPSAQGQRSKGGVAPGLSPGRRGPASVEVVAEEMQGGRLPADSTLVKEEGPRGPEGP